MEIELDLKEIKNIELEIMKTIDKICNEENLIYSLAGGSSIGAIRHKGFIPWDDDIDIMMFREDIKRLGEIINSKYKNEYKLLNCENTENYPYQFSKVVALNTEAKEIGINKIKDYGVFVDIFTIDGVPKNKIIRKIFKKRLEIMNNIILIKRFEEPISKDRKKLFIKKFLKFIFKPINSDKFTRKTYKYMGKYDKKSEIMGLLHGSVFMNNNLFFDKRFFEDVSYYEFEDTEFLMINGYDKFLKELFGDYMKLPNREDRVSGHNWEILKKIK